MAQGGGQHDFMGYEALAQEALRGVIRAALTRAAPDNMPGDHHFYISFKTRFVGVSIPPDLLKRYPDEMTIVLQHQFWDLTPHENFFSVLLSFGGQPKALSVPYAAITRFHDPSVQFVLQFEAVEQQAGATASSAPVSLASRNEPAPSAQPLDPAEPEGGADKSEAPKIVSLDQFRKK